MIQNVTKKSEFNTYMTYGSQEGQEKKANKLSNELA